MEVGELTGPEATRPVIVMADTSRTRVRAFVEELDAPRVETDMAASVVADGLPGNEFKGRVVRVSPRMGPKRLWSDRPAERHDTKTREIWIELEDADRLVMGLRVDVVIDPDRSTAPHPGESVPEPTSGPGDPPDGKTARWRRTAPSGREAPDLDVEPKDPKEVVK